MTSLKITTPQILVLSDAELSDTTGYRTVGSYEISKMCLQSYPCQHCIGKVGDNRGEYSLLSGCDIYKLLLEEGISDSHFDDYGEHARCMEHSTPEDIVQLQRDQMMEMEELCRKKEAIIIDHSSSTRTQRLKAQLLG
jgi:hypothetical protein